MTRARLAALALATLAGCGPTPFIAGGEPAEGGYEPVVAIARKPNPRAKHVICGGTLIDRRWVITAAHCDVQLGDTVVLGRRDLTQTTRGVERRVAERTRHPRYDRRTLDYDVALVRLDEAVSVTPIALAEASPAPTESVDVLGWGRTGQTNPRSDELLRASLKVIEAPECQSRWSGRLTVTARMICAAAPNAASCRGDSGGPLLRAGRRELVGVVSTGGCLGGEPGVYTRVPTLAPWVTCVIEGREDCNAD